MRDVSSTTAVGCTNVNCPTNLCESTATVKPEADSFTTALVEGKTEVRLETECLSVYIAEVFDTAVIVVAKDEKQATQLVSRAIGMPDSVSRIEQSSARIVTTYDLDIQTLI